MKHPSDESELSQLARLFFKLGAIGFGGPAAHIAMMEDEVVERRKWFSRQDFLDMVGATNLIPGPNSTEMAIHIGAARGGLAGLAIAGTAFILPAVTITTALAWIYVRYGTVPEAASILAGIRPVVVAIIFGALWKLAGSALKSSKLTLLAIAVGAAAAIGSNEILALLAGGLVAMITMSNAGRGGNDPGSDDNRGDDDGPGGPKGRGGDDGPGGADGRGEDAGRGGDDGGTVDETVKGVVGAIAMVTSGNLAAPLAAGAASAAAAAGVSLLRLGLYFLTVGSVLYGSGYVLFAFLEGGLVRDLGWLTQQQLVDAIAIGQFTPGPVLSTAAFIGYVIAGPAGAAVATLGIFLPSFVFVSLLARILPYLRRSPRLRGFLDGVNASAVALMAVVGVKLAMGSITGWQTLLLGVIAVVATVILRINAALVIVGGALAGWLLLS